METNYVCFVTLATGGKHKLTAELYNFLLEAGSEDIIEIKPGVGFKKSAVMEIEDISEWVEDKNFSYGQPYADLKALPSGNVYERSSKNGKELMLKGLRKVRPKATEEDLKKFLKTEGYKPLYNHEFDEQGKIIKPAWEVRAEALGEKPKAPKVQEEDLLPVI